VVVVVVVLLLLLLSLASSTEKECGGGGVAGLAGEMEAGAACWSRGGGSGYMPLVGARVWWWWDMRVK
jgi:hypothetical protein